MVSRGAFDVKVMREEVMKYSLPVWPFTHGWSKKKNIPANNRKFLKHGDNSVI
jgi:hypothetical protein